MNIVPLLTEHKTEICADLRQMYAQGVITESAFCCTLVPEGNPVLDKAEELGQRFTLFQQELSDCAVPAGILLQATIGHGWTPDSPATFQKLVQREGTERYMFCPLGEDFRAYITASVRRLARLRPAFFMVDDDFRMYTNRPGCFCPLHLAEFNRRTGDNYTRESILAAVDNNPQIALAYDRMLCDSLVEVAALIRSAIDETDPSIPCSFCTCEGDVRHAPEIARTLAAPGQQPLIRINNALYLGDSPRVFPQWLYRTAVQVAAMPEDIQVLSEPDTCPHNRYSTSAAIVHAHNTFSILEGCQGGKLWLDRLHSYEPNSGKAYRKILKQHSGFYCTLGGLRPDWQGITILMPEKPAFNFPHLLNGTSQFSNWAGTLLGRMGLPIHFSHQPGEIVALSGSEISTFSDNQLHEVLRGKVFLDGTAALALCERGFQEHLGISATEWNKEYVSFEKAENGDNIHSFGDGIVVKLTPLSQQTQTLSRLYHSPFAFSSEEQYLAPGATFFHNSAGGTVLTLASIAATKGFASFFMLNETRKRQLISLFNLLQPLPLYYQGDAEILLKTGRIPGGTLLAVLNIGLDTLDELPLSGTLAHTEGMERLTPEGNWEPLPGTKHPDGITLAASLTPLTPLICRL